MANMSVLELEEAEKTAVRRYLRETRGAVVGDSQQAMRKAAVEIAFIGDVGVGKKSIVFKLAYDSGFNKFDSLRGPFEEITISVEGFPIEVHLEEQHLNSYGWLSDDRHSISHFQATLMAMMKVEVIVLVYGVLRENALEHLDYALQKCREKRQETDNRLWFVAASQVDRAQSDWKTSLEEGRAFARRIGAYHLEMSAHSGVGTSREDLGRIVARALHHRAIVAGYTTVEPSEHDCEKLVQVPGQTDSSRLRKLWKIVAGKKDP